MASYREIFNFNFKILKYLGLWKINTKSSLKSQLYFTYQCFSLLILTLYNVLAYIDLYEIRQDIEKFNYNLCAVVTTTMTLIKTLRALQKLPELNKLTDALLRDPEFEENPNCKESLVKAAKEMDFINKIFYLLDYSLISIWLMTPLLDYKSGERKLPFRQWFPYDYKISPNYELTYLYQIFSCFITTTNIVATDLVTYGYMIRISAEYEILKWNIEKLNELEEFDEVKKDDKFFKIIKNCIKHHQEIIKRTRQFEEIYNKTLLLQFLGCTILLAVVGLDVMVMSTEFNSRFISQMFYLCAAMLDLFLFCLYGTRMQHKSYDIVETVFHTPWYLMKGKFRYCLTFMIAKAQEPLIVTGGKILNINFNAFLKVLKTTYNLLALCRQIASKSKK